MAVTTAPNDVSSDAGGLPGAAGISLTDVVDACIVHLGVPMSRSDALRLLGKTESPLAAPCQTLLAEHERKELVRLMIGLIILLDRGPFPDDAKDPPVITSTVRRHRAMLEAAADLANSIAGYTEDAYWQCIALSLRAECLYLLDECAEARAAATQSQAAYSKLTEPSAPTDHRAAYNRDLLEGKQPHVTTRRFLDSLHEEVLRLSPPIHRV